MRKLKLAGIIVIAIALMLSLFSCAKEKEEGAENKNARTVYTGTPTEPFYYFNDHGGFSFGGFDGYDRIIEIKLPKDGERMEYDPAIALDGEETGSSFKVCAIERKDKRIYFYVEDDKTNHIKKIDENFGLYLTARIFTADGEYYTAFNEKSSAFSSYSYYSDRMSGSNEEPLLEKLKETLGDGYDEGKSYIWTGLGPTQAYPRLHPEHEKKS